MKLLCFATVVVAGLAALFPVKSFGAEQGSSSFRLKHSPLAEMSEGRELLEYLVNCALPKGETAVLDLGGEKHEFPGGLGLAPEWRHRALTVTEQERVSACILARTNAFGVTVQISLRAMEGAEDMPAPLAASPAEESSFDAFEGAFFGNIFADPPVGYVCRGTAAATLLIERRRVCSLAADGDAARKPQMSLCAFRIVGPCSSPGATTVDGYDYTQGIRVFLKSGTAADQAAELQAESIEPQR